MTNPLEVYAERLAARRQEFDRLARLDAGAAYARLTAVATLVVLAILSVRAPRFSAWWMLAPVLAFVALAVWHDRVLRAKRCAAAACLFYEHRIARIEDRWAGTGSHGTRHIDESHPYANDLDLFGPASLFELLSLARTQVGELTLASWLKAPATAGEIALRQQAVAELRPHLD